MRVSERGWQQAFGIAAAIAFLLGVSARAQSIPSRVKQPVNDAQRVTLKGNVHPLARPEYDHGLAPDSLPMDRMLLVLKRSPQQKSALDKLLVAQQEKSSSEYHHWLTPKQFGDEFGPSDSDIQTVSDWLAAQGFQVSDVAAGRAVIEFSGSAGLVRQVFHAEIHNYVIKGHSYWANASNPQIPAALAPVVAGIVSLNNFPRKPMDRLVGVFSRSKATHQVKSLYTFYCPQGTSCLGQALYALGPTDFATIYNVLPLWNAETDGTGETIAIVADSNIDPSDVANFRSTFGLPPKPVNVILDGPDPGLVPDSETEADVDAEWAGGVAKNATIDLVVSEDTESTSGIDLSALYIVYNDLAPVLSESYGACEAGLGNAGNAFENAMWEQAAAEGITVVVAGGDSGSAGCDNPNLEPAAQFGLAVNGTASTPYNVAVGGTDFDNPSSYFSSSNDFTTDSSAHSYVPEITWNDSCARGGKTTGCSTVSSYGQDLTAGGGGASSCAVQGASGNCTSGYSKPAWQTGTGVPADELRDIPDVSLFAGDGLDGAFYIACESDNPGLVNVTGSCTSDLSNLDFLGIGGTSVSAPAFAGIMALVNQKTGQREGNANFVLYPLAAAAAKNNDDCTSNASAVSDSSCIFYDITQGHNASGTDITPGNNSVACMAGWPDCNAPTGYNDGILVYPDGSSNPAWTSTAGYDLASGLGSVNVANLVNNWGSVSFHSSATTLSLSPTTITHGQSVGASIAVTSSAGTPRGDVELMGNPATATNPSGSKNVGIAFFKLGSGGTISGTTNMLPGGTYNVFAHYAGDGTSGSSDSTPPIAVTVNPENSQTRLSFIAYNPITGVTTGPNPAPPSTYGSAFYLLRADVLNSAGNPCAPTAPDGEQLQPTSGCPTGTVTLTDNGNPLNDFNGSDAAPLNSQGYLEDQQVPLLTGGSYSLVANYSGDASFNPSSGTANFTISQAPTTLKVSITPTPVQLGKYETLNARINTSSLGVCPNGTFTFFVDGTQVEPPAQRDGCGTYDPTTSPSYAYAGGEGNTSFPTTGIHTLSAQYSGDANYQPSTATISVNVTKNQPQLFLMLNPSAIGLGQQSTLEVQLDGSGPVPTGTVSFYDGGTAIKGTVTYSPTGDELFASLPYTPTTTGAHNITATYSGDSNYASATGFATLTVQTPDFQLNIDGTAWTIRTPGQSISTQIFVKQVDGLAGTVNLSCVVTSETSVPAQDMPTCSLNPASVTLSPNLVYSTISVNTTSPSMTPRAPPGGPPAGRWPLGVWLGMVGLLGLAELAAWRLIWRRPALPNMPRGHGSPNTAAVFRWGLTALLATLLLGVALWGSCGGGGAGGGGTIGGGSNSGTPSGTYTVTVTGKSGNISHQGTMTVTVQ